MQGRALLILGFCSALGIASTWPDDRWPSEGGAGAGTARSITFATDENPVNTTGLCFPRASLSTGPVSCTVANSVNNFVAAIPAGSYTLTAVSCINGNPETWDDPADVVTFSLRLVDNGDGTTRTTINSITLTPALQTGTFVTEGATFDTDFTVTDESMVQEITTATDANASTRFNGSCTWFYE